MKPYISGLAGSFRQGFRLVFFRTTINSIGHSSLDSVIGLAAVLIVVNFACSYILSMPDPEFNGWGLVGDWIFLLNLLLAGYLFGRWTTGPEAAVAMLLRVLKIYIALTPIFTAVYLLSLRYIDSDNKFTTDSVIYVGINAWFALAVIVAIYRLTGKRRVPTARGSLIFLFVVFIPMIYVEDQTGTYWHLSSSTAERVDPYKDYRNIDVEEIYYRQNKLLAKVETELLDQRPNHTDLYWVGFGSHAYQNVFMSEVQFVQNLFDRRFDTPGRSVALINNLQTLERTPIANRHNLDQVLSMIGRRMNPEEDVLFLYLTSHGSRDGKLSVDFWPLGLKDLSAQQLKESLNRANIKWRVLVISACYSGSFIETLKDEFTLIATAAAEDRTSFGCSNTSKFTYFGEALFRDALSEQTVLKAALHSAMEAITTRENEEGKEQSMPQLFIGEQMELKLPVLDAAQR